MVENEETDAEFELLQKIIPSVIRVEGNIDVMEIMERF